MSRLTPDLVSELVLGDPDFHGDREQAIANTLHSARLLRDALGEQATDPCCAEQIFAPKGLIFATAVTGDILLFLLRCAQHHPEYMSVERAVFLMQRVYRDFADRNGNPANCGASTIKNAWAAHRPAAHLCAAFRMFLEEGKLSDDFVTDPQALLEFLAVSEHFRDLGQSFFASRQEVRHGPILDPSTTWRCPRFPELTRIEFEAAPLPKGTLEYLEKYSRTRKR